MSEGAAPVAGPAPAGRSAVVALPGHQVSERAFWSGTALASAVAILAAAVTLTRESLWRDELLTLAVVDRPLGAFLDALPHRQNGILYDVVLWPVVQLGGTSAAWLRLPALLAFAGAVVVAALVASRLAGRTAGLAAAFLLALHPFALAYAQEARPYGFVLLFTLLAVLLLQRAAERPSPWRWLAYALAVLASLFSHDFAVFALAAHPFLLAGRPRRVWLGFLVTLGAIVVLCSPLLLLIPDDLGRIALSWVPEPTVRDALGMASAISGEVAGAVACVAVLGAGLYALRSLRARGQPVVSTWTVAFLAIWLAAPVAGLFLFSVFRPVTVTRYAIASVPALCVTLGVALSLLRPRLALAGAALVAAAFLGAWVDDSVRLTKEDWPAATAYVSQERVASEPIAVAGDVNANIAGLLYYLPGDEVDGHRLPFSDSDLDRLPGWIVPVYDGRSTAPLSGARELVLVEAGLLQPRARAAIDALLGRCAVTERTFNGVAVLHATGCG